MQKQRGDPFVIVFKMYIKTPICILSDNDKTNIQSITNKTWDKIAEIRIIDFIYKMRTCDIRKIGIDGHFCLQHKYIYPSDW